MSRVVHSLRAFVRAFKSPAPVPSSTSSVPRIGIALGGGFARGLAHIGVLRVLQEEGIPIDYVAGTSVGSIVGALHCSGLSASRMQEIASKVRFRDFARWTLNWLGFCSNDRMDVFLRKILECRTFEELKTPLAVVATDFVTGDPVVFRSGSILDAVRASCAYPGLFTPVRVDGRLLVDGMLAHAVPSTPLREMGAERVLAVYLNARWTELKAPRNVFDVIGQCFSIAQVRMSGAWRRDADMVLEPNVDGFTYDGFDRAVELVRAGENAALAALPEIRSWLSQGPAGEPLASKPKITVSPQGLVKA